MTDFQFISVKDDGIVRLITLKRPKVLNAWHSPMKKELIGALRAFDRDETVRALVITGAGERAFCAGQDLNEATQFDGDAAEAWIEEFAELYGAIRALSKPSIAALNGVAAGSAFQFVLLMDVRIGHPGVRMGQPEINSGIASVTGPWIMREILGMNYTTELTLSGRLMDAKEALHIGALHKVVEEKHFLDEALVIARDLGNKAPEAMRIDKEWLREMSEPGFQAAMAAAKRYHRQSYEAGEPQKMAAEFLAKSQR
ncbi:MAG: enoyl-CoA hydratase/isomerase family protein [Hyphomicrobiales bacterium]